MEDYFVYIILDALQNKYVGIYRYTETLQVEIIVYCKFTQEICFPISPPRIKSLWQRGENNFSIIQFQFHFVEIYSVLIGSSKSLVVKGGEGGCTHHHVLVHAYMLSPPPPFLMQGYKRCDISTTQAYNRIPTYILAV